MHVCACEVERKRCTTYCTDLLSSEHHPQLNGLVSAAAAHSSQVLGVTHPTYQDSGPHNMHREKVVAHLSQVSCYRGDLPHCTLIMLC